MLHVICLFQPKQPSELRLKWRLTDMPRAMSYPQAVVINAICISETEDLVYLVVIYTGMTLKH